MCFLYIINYILFPKFLELDAQGKIKYDLTSRQDHKDKADFNIIINLNNRF
jgi:hypothetical protein